MDPPNYDPEATQPDADVFMDCKVALEVVELEEIRADFLALSDRMLCSERWGRLGLERMFEHSMDIVVQRRKFLAEFEDTYRKEHDE